MTRTAAELRSMNPVAFAVEENAKRNAQAKAEGWQMWSTMPEDAEWYAAMGYETAYDYELSCAKSTLSDVFKEINGWRPRGMYRLEDMDLDAVNGEIEKLYAREEADRAVDAAEDARIEAALAATRETPKGLTHNPFAVLLG